MFDAWAELDGRRWTSYGSGHINDTFLTDDGRYLLQKLNRHVFPNSEGVMRNLRKVVSHVGANYLIAPVPTRAGAAWQVDDAGDLWRLFPFAVGSRSFDRLQRSQLSEAARSFGRLIRDLADFDDTLETAIEGFHDLTTYLRELEAAREQTAADRDVSAALRFVDAYGLTRFDSPPRVIHGDCKVNNLLFDRAAERVTHVVDLDTVMLGDPAWDFGDLVRSAAAGSEESAAELHFNLQVFAEIARGFRRGLEAALDVETFAAAPGYMSFMLGVRFLTDHLRGDVYFKVAQRGQNLARAQAQFVLTDRLQAARPEMELVLRSV